MFDTYGIYEDGLALILQGKETDQEKEEIVEEVEDHEKEEE